MEVKIARTSFYMALTIYRASGIAYEMRDAQYDTPNRTLASGRIIVGVSRAQTSDGFLFADLAPEKRTCPCSRLLGGHRQQSLHNVWR